MLRNPRRGILFGYLQRQPIAFVRTVWALLALLALGVFAASIPTRLDQLLGIAAANHAALAQLGLSELALAWYIVALDSIATAIAAIIALVIFARRPDDRMTLFVSLMLLIYGVWMTRPADALVALDGPLRFGVDFVRALAQGMTLLFAYLFPDGRFVPRWTRRLSALWILVTLIWLLVPSLPYNLLRTTGNSLVASSIFVAWLATGLYAQIYRYTRVSSAPQRQQTKWVVFGITGAVIGAAVFLLLGVLWAPLRLPGMPRLLYICIGVPSLYLGGLLVPLSIAFSILRYRLWDIDLLIRRTLVYSLLTSTLILVYFGSVVALQLLFRAVVGEQSGLAVVASTLGIAALFNPLRRRLQRFIDRRFYRREYDAAHTLQSFAATLREEVDLGTLTHNLVAVVDDAMRPSHVSLWLRDDAKTAQSGVERWRRPRAPASVGLTPRAE
jgi:hypothetical protein